jgi:hypothetical protein
MALSTNDEWSIAMAENSAALPPLPKSLDGYTIPKERLELILPHMLALATTALRVSDTLPLAADASDFIRVLEDEGK